MGKNMWENSSGILQEHLKNRVETPQNKNLYMFGNSEEEEKEKRLMWLQGQ